jgi:DNA topoisomerase-1
MENKYIPPGYTDVKTYNNPNSKIYATGYDKKGRKQILYNKWYIEKQKNERFKKIIDLKDEFLKIFNHCNKIVATKKINTESKICFMILLIINCNFRIGNEKYFKLYKSYGVSTLEWRHIKINTKNNCFEIKFIGKKGVENCSNCKDVICYNYIKKLLKVSKEEKIDLNGDDRVFNISASQVNDYISKFGNITCKDLRTWRANYLFIEYYMNDAEEDIKKRKMNALKKVAEELHNTPTVCKNNYLLPGIF